MATIIYPTAASVYTRVIDTTGLSEFHIDIQPNLVFVLTGSYPNTSSVMFIQGYDTGSTYPISSSWSLNVVSASRTTSGSYAVTASYALNAAGTSQLNGTNPTYKLYATASLAFSSLTSTDTLTGVSFTSSNARTDGGDIRVQWADNSGSPSGSYLPITVGINPVSGSVMQYSVFWTDTYISNSQKKVVITYGDPLGNSMYINQAQSTVLKKRGMLLGNYVVYNDNSQADWFPNSSWGTVGTRLGSISGVDDASTSFATPTPYAYGGTTQVSFSIGTNGCMRYGSVGAAMYTPPSPDYWGINNQDARLVWCDVCVGTDGWFLQYYNQRALSIAGNYKAVIRYRNNGKFILSIFDTDASYQANFGSNTLNGYVGTYFWSYNSSTVITASNPLTAVAIVIEPLASAGLSGSEQPYP